MGTQEPYTGSHAGYKEDLPSRLRTERKPEDDPLFKFFVNLMDALQREPAIMANICFGKEFELQYNAAFGARLTTPQVEEQFITAKLQEYIEWAKGVHSALQKRLDALARREELSNLSHDYEGRIVTMMTTVETLSRTARGEWKEYAKSKRMESQLQPVGAARKVASSLQPIQQTLASMAYHFMADFKPAYATFAKRNLPL